MIRSCPHCQSKNRIPPKHLADKGRCGACKQALPALSTAINVDNQSFKDIIREARVPVLVDFWADWCGPCKAAAPEVAAAAQHLAGKAIVLKVNTEQNQALANEYAVRSIPNFALFRNGRVVWQQAGLLNHQQLEQVALESA